jgi:hypothetical protein
VRGVTRGWGVTPSGPFQTTAGIAAEIVYGF